MLARRLPINTKTKQDLFCKNTEEIRRHIGNNSTVFLLLCIVETLTH